jgi:FG-GAP repeat
MKKFSRIQANVSKSLSENSLWTSTLLGCVLSIFLLASCNIQPAPRHLTEDKITAVFTDTDIDRAALETATRQGQLSGTDEGTAGEAVTLADLPTLEGSLTSQAVLPTATGFVYYIEHDPSSATAPFKLFRHEQGTDTSLKVFEGLREIQAVAGSTDGNTVVVSMRETTKATSDFEIFRLRISPARTQRLTNNSVDDSNVSLSADGLKLVWEQPILGLATLVLRTYDDRNTTVNFQENVLTFSLAQRQPSLSGNGRFIALVRDLADGRDQVVRFDVSSNRYLGIASSTATLEHPSVSNDGDKVLFLQQGTTGNDLARLRTISAATTQTVVGSPTLEHPFLTADGKFVVHGLLQNGVLKVFTKDLATGQQLRLTNPVSPVNHLGMMWQMPFASQQKVVLRDGSQNSSFGSAVAMNGSLMVVGGFGHAYLLSGDTFGTWTVFKTLTASDSEFFDNFGSAVAISGDTVVVGAFGKARDLDGDGQISRTFEGNVGAAYIFERNEGGADNWGEVKKLVLNDGGRDDRFGFSVAISGDVVAVGSRPTFSPQPVYLFGRNQGGVNTWGEVKELRGSDQSSNQHFGFSVAVSGNTIVVGSPAHDADTNNDGIKEGLVGAAYIFQKDQGGTNNWGEVKELTASDFAESDSFGSSVAISGNIVVIGANVEDHDTTNDGADESDTGAAYIFSRNQGGSNIWGEVKKLEAKDGATDDQFGISVSISGDLVVVGAFIKARDTDNDGVVEEQVGAAYVFARNEGGTDNWGELRKLLAADGTADDFYGEAVAVSGNVVAVGAPLNDNSGGSSDGAVYVDER